MSLKSKHPKVNSIEYSRPMLIPLDIGLVKGQDPVCNPVGNGASLDCTTGNGAKYSCPNGNGF